MYANLPKQIETETLPQLAGRVNCTWDNSKAEYMALGWREITERIGIPEGTIATGKVEYVQNGLEDECTAVAEYKTAEQVAADRKAAMAAKLTPGIITLAQAYRTALRTMFGADAEINHAVTQDAVVGMLMQLPAEQFDAKTADMLKLAFDQLSAIAEDGTTWTFFETVGDLIPEGGA